MIPTKFNANLFIYSMRSALSNKKIKDFIVSTRNDYVFLVDDNLVYLTMMQEEIKKFLPNSRILSFTSGESCLEKIDLHPFLILLDFDLSGESKNSINGMKTLREIKHKSPNTEVVMLSGVDNLKIVVNSMKFGAFDYVVKGEHAMNNLRSKIGHVVRKLRIRDGRAEKNQFNWLFKWITILVLLVVI